MPKFYYQSNHQFDTIPMKPGSLDSWRLKLYIEKRMKYYQSILAYAYATPAK
jgi:hypothetical protein